MKNILVIGSTGQIGSELTRELRKIYGNDHVVAGYIKGAEPKGELLESGPSAEADVTNGEMIASVVKQYNIDTIYNLAALLSVVAESKPRLAWKIGIDGLWNILEVAREHGCAVFTPSSIGSFGPSTPKMMTPQDTIQRPRTMSPRLPPSCSATIISISMASIPVPCASPESSPMSLLLVAAPPTMLSTSITRQFAASASYVLSRRAH